MNIDVKEIVDKEKDDIPIKEMVKFLTLVLFKKDKEEK